ncbi:Glyco-hydro-cc domain-containing protein [Salix suchowensis]|nr:Glyco-hydro-cc domain-containing protein [Salix suchowensis]
MPRREAATLETIRHRIAWVLTIQAMKRKIQTAPPKQTPLGADAEWDQGGTLRRRCLRSAERPHRMVVRLVAHPAQDGSPIGVPMLWGAGTVDAQDAKRYAQFKKLTSPPPYVLGFEEPDCEGNGSAGMSVDDGVYQWEKMIAPLKAREPSSGAPRCADFIVSEKGRLMDNFRAVEQADETWLAQFNKKVKTPWDFTAIHINKDNMAGVQKDLVSYSLPLPAKRKCLPTRSYQDHYWNTYKKPIWVTDSPVSTVRSDVLASGRFMGKINTFINQIVDPSRTTPESSHTHIAMLGPRKCLAYVEKWSTKVRMVLASGANALI